MKNKTVQRPMLHHTAPRAVVAEHVQRPVL